MKIKVRESIKKEFPKDEMMQVLHEIGASYQDRSEDVSSFLRLIAKETKIKFSPNAEVEHSFKDS